MYKQHRFDQPDRKFSTGVPIGMMLLAMVLIGGYLFIGSEFTNDSRQTVAIVLPTPVPTAK